MGAGIAPYQRTMAWILTDLRFFVKPSPLDRMKADRTWVVGICRRFGEGGLFRE